MTSGPRFLRTTASILLALTSMRCSHDDGAAPITTGTLTGVVTDASTSAPIAGARVLPIDANTNGPAGSSTFTSGDGSYSLTLPQGTYYARISKQGYEQVPPPDISPLPLNVAAGQTTTYSVQMFASPATGAGSISGTVTSGGDGAAGVLVTAHSGNTGYASVTDGAGGYWIYNVPAGQYTVTGWLAGCISSDSTVTVVSGTEAAGVNLVMSQENVGAVSGLVTFLATTNIEVDISLLDPKTRLTIPGLTAVTTNQRYTIARVPPGTYLARATYRNDGKVVDPDWIIKNGEPTVTAGTGTVTRDFSVTGAVDLASPTNPASSTQPLEILTTSPTFSWVPYASSDDYVIEVINSNGKVIWGGFSSDYTVKNISIPKTQTSIAFDIDSTATEQLEPGKIYRWKIYASKDDIREPTGWKLISASEDQRGIITVRP